MSVTSWFASSNWRGRAASSTRGYAFQFSTTTGTVPDRAVTVNDMAYPGSFLHPLKGGLGGFWSVRISGSWRVIFRFENGDAYAVAYVDYH